MVDKYFRQALSLQGSRQVAQQCYSFKLALRGAPCRRIAAHVQGTQSQLVSGAQPQVPRHLQPAE